MNILQSGPQPREHSAGHTKLHRCGSAALRGLWRIITVFALSRNNDVICTLVQALSFSACITDHSVYTVIALVVLDNNTRRVIVIVTPRPLLNPRKKTVPIVQDAVWAPGPF